MQHGFNDEAVGKSLGHTWVPIESENSKTNAYTLTVNEVNQYDNFWWPRLRNTTFLSMQPYNSETDLFSKTIRTSIMIGFNQDKVVIERKVYSLFDWLNEVGGFEAILRVFVQVFMPIVQVWSLDKYLVSKLFKRFEKDLAGDDDPNKLNRSIQSVKKRKDLKPP